MTAAQCSLSTLPLQIIKDYYILTEPIYDRKNNFHIFVPSNLDLEPFDLNIAPVPVICAVITQ